MAGEPHILSGAEEIASPAKAVFQVLTDVTQAYKQFASSTTSVDVLTPEKLFGEGFQWRETRCVLYLREDCIFTVTHFNESELTYALQMDDGFNHVTYSFKVQPSGCESATVFYSVDCRMRYQGANSEAYQPSERLARMMAKQDGQLVKRLKTHMESCYPVQCF